MSENGMSKNRKTPKSEFFNFPFSDVEVVCQRSKIGTFSDFLYGPKMPKQPRLLRKKVQFSDGWFEINV